ncbi:SPFH domain-containing protein [Streptomyces sp. NBC_01214]|uniref:SPFH domain-containing protein n=1 Tax=Streptomyces sp. NBC_01214 TaxID=2903777 RepID=UPI00225B20A1|nr:SPFH domain-containing protein [Streptomyces sp. NBC_01214]MCX4801322.1 SPFH domain-containing protein [Streptomyces sp. NBC_01214]
MFPTRTTSTTGTLRVPPLGTPVAARAADPAPVPEPAPAPLPEPEPAVPAAAHPVWAAEPTTPVPEPVHASVAVAVAAPRDAAQPSPPPALVGSPAAPEHAVAAETSFGWAAARAARPAPELPHGWEVPAARAHPYEEGDRGAAAPSTAAGLDIPHPQDPEAPAGPATLRLRTADVETDARPEADSRPEARPEPVAEPEAALEAAPEPVAAFVPVPVPDFDFDFDFDAKSEPDPDPEPEPGPEAAAPEPVDAAPRPRSGIPGPGPVEIVAQAVARGLDEAGAAPDLPGPGTRRGTSVTEVPVHIPFHGTQQLPAVHVPAPAPQVTAPAPQVTAPAPQVTAPAPQVTASAPQVTASAPQATASATRAPRPAPGRRVPRGDDRLREHRGPVLPGWVGVVVGGTALAGCAAVLWRAGVVPAAFVAAFGAAPRAYHGLRATHWPPLAFLGIVALVSLGGLGRARAGHAWVLTLFGRYRGTVRRTGLTWVSPLLLRRRVDVRLRHWRSDPMPAVDAGGLALQVVVQVVWQVKDTARATLAVEDHTEYLAEQVESAMARVLSQLPADAFHEDAPTLRDTEAVGDALTRMLAAETEAVGIEVFSAQPTRIEYAAEVAEAMRRRRVAAIDAKHRDTVLSSVVDAVDDTVHRLTSRGLVELDDYERKALVKDLTVAFYTGRSE